MELRPKHSVQPSRQINIPATRQFTDREKPRKAFSQFFQTKAADPYKVLTYYGIGGIGKTRLQKELYHMLDDLDDNAIKAMLDFKEEKHRNPGHALIWLREELKQKYKVKFPTFDLVYAIYWKKSNPQLSLKAGGNNLPFLEEGTFIGELVSHLEDVPFAMWLPKTLKFVDGLSRYKEMAQWWSKEGQAIMKQLQELQPNEIEERLPAYWAVDLQKYLHTNNRKAVLFLDTYEALWENNRQLGDLYVKDEWVQELVLQLPEVFWVICGREQIQWAHRNEAWKPYLEQHLIGELSPKDSADFLQACGIKDSDVQKMIISSSQGLPYHLDLMVDTYYLIREKRLPEPADFSETPQQILERFIRYLDLSEKETLKILSFARLWDRQLFQTLVTAFKTGYPATSKDLFRFSFINYDDQTETGDMHGIMRANLQEDLLKTDPLLYKQVHTFLFDYYEERIKRAEPDRFMADESQAVREALYHGSIVFDAATFLTWFLKIGKHIKAAGQFELLTSIKDNVSAVLPPDRKNVQHGFLDQFFGEIYLLQGKYKEAIQVFQSALAVFHELLPEEEEACLTGIGKSSISLAEVMIQTTDYDSAYQYLTAAADYYHNSAIKKDAELLLDEAFLYIRLGKLNIRFAQYETAKQNYNYAIACCDAGLAERLYAPLLAAKALAFEKLGELYDSENHEQQGQCYQTSIQLYEEALKNKKDISYLRVLTNKGLAHKRLAEHYDPSTQLAEKLNSYEQAISIYDQVLEQSPMFIDALEKKGHAAVDYMALQIDIGLFDQAHATFRQAIDAFNQALELSAEQGSSRNRLASAHRELGGLYLKQGDRKTALAMLEQSLKLSEEMFIHSPTYIYIHNSLGKTEELIGDLYAQFGEQAQAEIHYDLAIEQYNKMLQKAPNLREAMKRKENIYQTKKQKK